MSVFVTTMYRYGNRELHSYVLGVWSTLEIAMQAGETEALRRGGNYEPQITEWEVDKYENQSDLLELAISQYVGHKCQYCEYFFSSVKDIYDRDVVYAGDGKYACKVCYQANHVSLMS